MNIIENFETEQIKLLTANKTIPSFQSGDSVEVKVKIKEGTVERIQSFEGVVIARRNRGLSSSFVVRKISFGEGVERNFKLYSPIIHSINVVKRGVVRRSKLYYLRQRSGKSARIKQRLNTK